MVDFDLLCYIQTRRDTGQEEYTSWYHHTTCKNGISSTKSDAVLYRTKYCYLVRERKNEWDKEQICSYEPSWAAYRVSSQQSQPVGRAMITAVFRCVTMSMTWVRVVKSEEGSSRWKHGHWQDAMCHYHVGVSVTSPTVLESPLRSHVGRTCACQKFLYCTIV